jgi:hypothetical protein
VVSDLSSVQNRDVVVFIAGLGQDPLRTTASVAELISRQFDSNAHTKSARFEVVTNNEKKNGVNATYWTIVRIDENRREPIIDIYGLNYTDALLRRFQERNAIGQAFALSLVLIANAPAYFQLLLRNRGKALAHRIQFLYVSVIMALLVGYMGLLVFSVFQLVQQAAGTHKNVTWPQFFTLAGAALGALFPGLRNKFTAAAVQYISVILYLKLPGASRGEIIRRLTDLLETVSERPDVNEIHIWAYSFGTVIALDSLYPISAWPPYRYRDVRQLVTIGCPFDIIRQMWPRYFMNRHAQDKRPHWINVYDPSDVLGSNFRQDQKVGAAEHGIQFVSDGNATPNVGLPYNEGMEPRLSDLLLLHGLSAHDSYWVADSPSENCFGSIITALYPDADVLK